MKFLDIDQHISVVADLQRIFKDLGHEIVEMSLSGHAGIVGRKQAFFPELDGDNWCRAVCEKDYEKFYKNNKELLDKFDGFVVCYPPAFSLLYKYTNKPIIMHIPIRYEYGMNVTSEDWEYFNNYLREGVDNKRIFVCANSPFDTVYTESFLNRPVTYIPSLCEYTKTHYNPVRSDFVAYSGVPMKSPKIRMKKDVLRIGHSWQSVMDFNGIIHYPYQVSTMSIFEQYTACVPLFFPTKKYLFELWEQKCPVLFQVSWNRIFGKPEGSLIKSSLPYDPNNYKDPEVIKQWMELADYYSSTMKHITHFDTIQELNELVNMTKEKLLEISEKMRIHNIERKKEIYKSWTKVLANLS